MAAKAVVEGRSKEDKYRSSQNGPEDARCKPGDTYTHQEAVPDHPPNKNSNTSNWCQGEEFAGARTYCQQNTQIHQTLSKFDTILMSSSIIPGNEQLQ